MEKGNISKLQKIGDKTEYNNWRGITLLPTIFFKNRGKHQVNAELRKEQVRFRQGRSCCDQMLYYKTS